MGLSMLKHQPNELIEEAEKALAWALDQIPEKPFEWTAEEQAESHRHALDTLDDLRTHTNPPPRPAGAPTL